MDVLEAPEYSVAATIVDVVGGGCVPGAVPPLHYIIMFYKVNVILKIKLSKNKILQFGLCLCVLSLKTLKIRKIYNLKKFFPITIPFKSVIFFFISCA